MIKKTLLILALILGVFNSVSATQNVQMNAPMIEEFKDENTFVLIHINDHDVLLQLMPSVAPNTVKNFLSLVDQGFYNQLKFHRVEPGFVVQGGDPKGNGTGGPGYKIPAEFNSEKHLVGVLAMARASHPDSAGSQFYICLADLPFLDGKYTVFGKVIEGMDTVLGIKKNDKIQKMVIVNREKQPVWYNRAWFSEFKKVE